jgi:kinetochore protein Nuf2
MMNYSTANARAPQGKWPFPILDDAETLLCLHELQIAITDEVLGNPEKHKDHIRRILETLAELVTGISREEMNQPAFSGLSQLNYPELHEESVPQINSFRAIQQMMEVCGVNNFSIKDFMTPTTKRVKVQLSAIINFIKFRTEKEGLLNELTTQRDALLAQLNKARSNHETLNMRLASLREQTQEESKLIEQTEQEIKDTEAEISDLNLKQAEIRDEIADLKLINNQLKDSIGSRLKQLEDATATKKKLQSQIVNSPERFRKQIVDSSEALQREQKEIKSQEKKTRDLTGWLVQLDEALSSANAAMEAMEGVKAEVDTQKEALALYDEQQDALRSRREVLKTVNQNTQHLARQTTKAEEKLSAIRKQADTRTSSYQATRESLHQQLLEAEEAKTRARARAEKAEAEAAKLEMEVELDAEQFEQVCYLTAFHFGFAFALMLTNYCFNIIFPIGTRRDGQSVQ